MNTIYVISIICVMSISLIGTIVNNRGKKEKENKPTKICLWIIIIILTIISGMRNLSYIQGDEYRYRLYFNKVDILGSQIMNDDREIGYWFINYLLTGFTNNDQSIIILCAIISNILIIINLYKFSNYFNFTLFLYITSGIYFESFNAMRQYLAVAILFQAMNYIFKKDVIKYIICIIFATSFHFSAIVMLPMYWLVQVKNKKKVCKYIIIIFIVIFIAFSTVMNFLGTLMNKLENYNEAYNSDKSYGVNIIRVLVIALPVILLVKQYEKIIKKDKKLEIMYIYSVMCMMIIICSYKYVHIARLSSYFLLQEILIIPELIYLIKKQKNRIIILLLTYSLYFTYGYIDASKNLVEYRNYDDSVVIKPIILLEK